MFLLRFKKSVPRHYVVNATLCSTVSS